MTRLDRRLASVGAVIVVGVLLLVVLESTRSDSTVAAEPEPTSTTVLRAPRQSQPVEPGTVGFMGDESTLTVIDDSENAPDGTVWIENDNYLRVNTDDLVLDGVYIMGGLDFYGSGTLTIRNSIIEGGHGGWQTIMLRDTGNRLELSDSTLRWDPAGIQSPGSGPGSIQISGRHSVSIVRNDISGMPDGIQVTGDDIVITDNWIHDLITLGEGSTATHNDGIQLYESSTNVLISRNHIDIGVVEGHSNGAMFASGPSSGELSNNYLAGGGYSLRLTGGEWAVAGNVFGPDHLFSYATIADVELDEWSDNTASDGTIVDP